MHCPSCGHSNRSGAHFCGKCAAPLSGPSLCAGCGASNPVGQSFCDACGNALGAVDQGATAQGAAGQRGEYAPAARKALGASARATGEGARGSVIGRVRGAADPRLEVPAHLAEKIRAGRGGLQGERKQVSVLFADVVGSMALSEHSDPEQWRQIMERVFTILCEGVHRLEGTVDKFTGDGIMALFGAPIAHEDHALRACHAALHLKRELAAHGEELRRAHGIDLAVRIGLNSGEVVFGAIGEDLAIEYTAVGHMVGLAQRMESLAEPGTAYLTQRTASLVEGFFNVRDLGEFQVNGVSRPVRVYELAGVGVARGRMDVQRERGLSRFVGREEEMELLESALERSVAGQGQVVGIVGEPGIGKSRLCHELTEHCRARGLAVYGMAAQAHTRTVPLLPVLELLRSYFKIAESDSDEAARQRIEGGLLSLDRAFEEDMPLIFDFLAVHDPARPVPQMDPEARQRQLLSLMRRLAHAGGAREPGVVVLEDMHWLDPASEVFVANHVEAIRNTRGLAVLTFRPEYQASWMTRSYYRQVPLTRLSAGALEELLSDLLGTDPSLDGVVELISERTEGNPFFVEELVRSLVEAGSLEGEPGSYRLVATVERLAAPASVQAVLSARIDRLGAREKEVLQSAAVIGRELPGAVLERVVELDRRELEEALHGLRAREFLYEQRPHPEALYAFRHPLTQEVAYRSQLADRRATRHAQVARAIAEQYPERLDERAALIAHHFERADDALEAARWHARAAAWSGFNDPAQALGHWRKVQELADSLPASQETTALALTARICRLQFAVRLGISPEEAEQVFREAEQMASDAGDVRLRASVIRLYGAIRGITGGEAREYAQLLDQALALAEESGDPELYIALSTGAYGLFCAGKFREAVAVVDRAIELAAGDRTVAAGTTMACPYAFCHTFKGGMLIFLGRLDEAGGLIEQGIELAHEAGDIETVGFGRGYITLRAYLEGEPDVALGHAQPIVESAERIGSSFSRAWSWSWLGIAQLMRQDWQQAIHALERSLAISTEGHTTLEARGWRLALLGEAYLGAGDVERARALAQEGVDATRAHNQVTFEMLATLSLVRVLLGSAGAAAGAEIEAALGRALGLAHETGAKALEPLVHVELAELAHQSRDEDCRQRELGEAHRLFTEVGAAGRAEEVARQLVVSTRRFAKSV
jgi:class 3 adenylate cyclase/tetratricopeptide (TPR) repeat protein